MAQAPVFANGTLPTLSILGNEKQTTEQGVWGVIHLELAKALVTKAGFQPAFEELPWNRALANIESGRLELITYLTKTPARETFAEFIGIAAYEQAGLVVTKDNVTLVKSFKTLNDLLQKNYRWGAQQNVWYSDELEQRLQNDTALKERVDMVSKITLNLSKVQKGRITGAFVENLSEVKYLVKSDKAQYGDLVVMEVPFLPPSPVYFATSKKAPAEKRNKLHAAYDELQGQEAFASIIKKWIE